MDDLRHQALRLASSLPRDSKSRKALLEVLAGYGRRYRPTQVQQGVTDRRKKIRNYLEKVYRSNNISYIEKALKKYNNYTYSDLSSLNLPVKNQPLIPLLKWKLKELKGEA